MAKIIFLNFGQSIESYNNSINEKELDLERVKQKYYRHLQLFNKKDTLSNFTEFVCKNSSSIEEAYTIFGY